MIKEVIGDTIYSTNTLGNNAHEKGTGRFKSENTHTWAKDFGDTALRIMLDLENEHSIYWSDAKDVQQGNSSLGRKHIRRFIKKNKDLTNSLGLNRFSENEDFDKQNKDEYHTYLKLQQIQELNNRFPYDPRSDSAQALIKNRERFVENFETDQTFDKNISVPYFENALTKLTQTDKIFREFIGNKYQMATEYEDIRRAIDIFLGNFNPNILYPILDKGVHKVDLKTTKYYLGTTREKIDGYEHPSFAFPIGKMFNNGDINEFEEVFENSFSTHYAFNILRSNLTQEEITDASQISESKLYYILAEEIHNFYRKNVQSVVENVIPTFKTFPDHEELEEKLSDIAVNNHYKYNYRRLEEKDKDVYSMKVRIPDFPNETMKVLFQVEGRKYNDPRKLQLSVRVRVPADCFENNPNCYYKHIK